MKKFQNLSLLKEQKINLLKDNNVNIMFLLKKVTNNP